MAESNCTSNKRIDIKLPRGYEEKLDAFRMDDESFASVVIRLIDERLVQEEVGVASITEHDVHKAYAPNRSAVFSTRITEEELDRLDAIRNEGESKADLLCRLLDERSLYRLVAKEMAMEGRRVQHNHVAVIHNFKVIIHKLVRIDLELTSDPDILQQDTDELVAELLDKYTNGGDDL